MIRDMIRAVQTYHVGWQVWMAILVSLNYLISPFLLPRPEAIWTLVSGGVAIAFFVILYKIQGFTRLLGLAHLPWLLLVPYLYGRISAYEEQNFYILWLYAIVVLNSISLVIDVTDIIRYIAGDRRSRV